MMEAASLFSILLLSAIQSQVAPHLLGEGHRLCTGCG